MGRGPHGNVRVADPPGLPRPGRLDSGGAAPARGRGLRRADEHGRVRDGLLHREQRDSAHAQPVGPREDPGRLVGRQRRRRRRRNGAGRARIGHGRLDPPAGRLLRRRRVQADVRARLAVRARRVRVLARPDRSIDEERRRTPRASYGVLAGSDPLDSTSSSAEPGDPEAAAAKGGGGLRVGVLAEAEAEGLDPEVAKNLDEARRVFLAAGASVSSVSVPRAPAAIAIYYVVASAEASSNLARYDGIRYGPRLAASDLALPLRGEPDARVRSGGEAADPSRDVRARRRLLRRLLRPRDARSRAPVGGLRAGVSRSRRDRVPVDSGARLPDR